MTAPLVVRRLCPAAIDLIRHFEGFSPTVYLDAAGLPTIGIGHLIRPGETFAATITEVDAEALLRRDLGLARHFVQALTRVPLSDGEFGALTSFVFNLGAGSYQRSTLRMKLNRGDYAGAAGEFWKWRRAGGIILAGLVRRRAAERALFLSEINSSLPFSARK